MKFYVAGRFTDQESIDWIKNAIIALEKQGHTCTFNWTNAVKLKPYEDNSELSAEHAVRCVEAVKEADLFILVSHPTGTGMYVEYGVALSENLRIGSPKMYLIGNYNNCSMFNFHPALKWKTSLESIVEDFKASVAN